MKLNHLEIGHLVFLAEVVLNGKKKSLMEETYQCLLYIVKSLEEAELPDAVGEQIQTLVQKIEEELRNENIRIREIRGALTEHNRRNI
jgi:hypothetical protein